MIHSLPYLPDAFVKIGYPERCLGRRLEGAAAFSLDQEETHRYLLGRWWGGFPHLLGGVEPLGITVGFVMLNPSTANQDVFDPTVRRCMGFALDLKAGGMLVANLFAFRATDPEDMKDRGRDAIGPSNDAAIVALAEACDVVICAWGTHGAHLGRDAEVKALLKPYAEKVHALSLTKHGHPGHPLYLPKSATPIPFDLNA